MEDLGCRNGSDCSCCMDCHSAARQSLESCRSGWEDWEGRCYPFQESHTEQEVVIAAAVSEEVQYGRGPDEASWYAPWARRGDQQMAGVVEPYRSPSTLMSLLLLSVLWKEWLVEPGRKGERSSELTQDYLMAWHALLDLCVVIYQLDGPASVEQSRHGFQVKGRW